MQRSLVKILLGMSVAVPMLPWQMNAQALVTDARYAPVSPRQAQTPAPRRVSLRISQLSLERALREIGAQAGVRMSFSSEVTSVRTPVTLVSDTLTVEGALAVVLRPHQLRAVRNANGDGFVVVSDAGENRLAKQGVIVGKVIHAKTKQPLAGVRIVLGDATQGVTTGDDGTFRISVNAGRQIIHARLVGFTQRTVQVTVANDESTVVEIVLEHTASVLDEVVVTGTVVATERKAIPNPITVITAEDIEKRGITRIEQFFRGEVPGVLALDRGSEGYLEAIDGSTDAQDAALGGLVSSKVYARGSSTLEGKPNPLKTYIDGVEMLDPNLLGTLDPTSIERIEIITGPQAATIYGSGAVGGVMQIFTKQGSGKSRPDMNANLRFGFSENNMSLGKTPSHNHTITMSGGSGTDFSYSASGSYAYTGQWQPGLFSRRLGLSIGARHTQGPVAIHGSVSITQGANGTTANTPGNVRGVYASEKIQSGEWAVGVDGGYFKLAPTRSIAGSGSQTLTLSLDHRISRIWQHSMTVGRNQTHLDQRPQAPRFVASHDSLFQTRSADGARTSANYHTSLQGPITAWLNGTLSIGLNGSAGRIMQVTGQSVTKTSATLVSPTVQTPVDSKTYGGFGTARLGIANQLFVTLGVRGERSPYYGAKHAIDWTPVNGITYTFDLNALTVKWLASYGRATRPPREEMRLQIVSRYEPIFDPPQYISQIENSFLTPEYSQGPQAGVELYYANRGTLTVNWFNQSTKSLIQKIAADSVTLTNLLSGSVLTQAVSQYINSADIQQKGWEVTGSVNLWALTLKGTYSWNDSRIVAVYPGPRAQGAFSAKVGTFGNLPTHAGYLAVGYALGKTNILLTTNIVGASVSDGLSHPVWLEKTYLRLATYAVRARTYTAAWTRPGYAKSDLSISHQLNRMLAVTAQITNLNDSYGTESGAMFTPAVGRQTFTGLSIRY